jgi:hypothetical protein
MRYRARGRAALRSYDTRCGGDDRERRDDNQGEEASRRHAWWIAGLCLIRRAPRSPRSLLDFSGDLSPSGVPTSTGVPPSHLDGLIAGDADS